MTFPPILQEYRFDLAGAFVVCLGSLAWYRRIHLPSRRAIARRIAHRLLAKAAGWDAQERAEAEAMGRRVVLEVIP